MAYNRKCVVEFDAPDAPDNKVKRIEGVDVKFRIEYLSGAVMNECEISICNLNREDIEFLTTYTSKWLQNKQRKRLRVYAGYEDEDQLNVIFEGEITMALPTDPPDVWLQCTALSSMYKSIEMYSKSILESSSVRSICEQAASWVEKKLEWNSKSDKRIEKFDFSGGYKKLLSCLSDLDDIIVFDDGENIVVCDRDNPTRTGTLHHVNEQTGMVFMPKIDPIGAEIKTFLNTRFRRGDTIELTSRRVPIANGRYNIVNIIHEGHLRGELWYTTLKTRRLDIYGKAIT